MARYEITLSVIDLCLEDISTVSRYNIYRVKHKIPFFNLSSYLKNINQEMWGEK